MTIFSEKYATIFNINLLSLKCKIYLNIDEACARVERPLYLLKIINKVYFPFAGAAVLSTLIHPLFLIKVLGQ